MARGNSRASSERETPFFRAEREAAERRETIIKLKKENEAKKQDVIDILKGMITDSDRNAEYGEDIAKAIEAAAKSDDFSKIDDVIEEMNDINNSVGPNQNADVLARYYPYDSDKDSLGYAQRYLREWEKTQARIDKLEDSASADYQAEQQAADDYKYRND